MTKGVILFANNNDEIDYVRQAIFCAKHIKKHLNLPVSLITDSEKHLQTKYSHLIDTFDKVISAEKSQVYQRKTFRDGRQVSKKLQCSSSCFFICLIVFFKSSSFTNVLKASS